MKALRFAATIVAGLVLSWAVPGALADVVPIFNTGVDGSGGLLDSGSIDPHYSLIISADLGPDAFVVIPSGYPLPERWFANDSSSQWIAPQASGGALDDGIYVYRTTVDLTAFDYRTAVLTGRWSSDNAGVDILINGSSTGFTTPLDQFESGFASFNITSGFVPGLNTLDFEVQNGAIGFDPFSPTGLRVEISGTAEAMGHGYPVPEANSLLLLGTVAVVCLGALRRRARQN